MHVPLGAPFAVYESRLQIRWLDFTSRQVRSVRQLQPRGGHPRRVLSQGKGAIQITIFIKIAKKVGSWVSISRDENHKHICLHQYHFNVYI